MSAASVPLPVRCTICNGLCQDTSGWYGVDCINCGPALQFHCTIVPLDEVLAKMLDGVRIAAACGEKCVHVLVSRWLESRTFEAVSANRPKPSGEAAAAATSDQRPETTPENPC